MTESLYSMAAEALNSFRAEVPNRPRITDDEQGVLMAFATALRADCSRRRVGAVFVDKQGRVVSTGRNGAPAGREGCMTAGACPRGLRSYDEVAPGSSYAGGGEGACIAIHGEANGLLYASRDQVAGGTVYVTDAPCDECSLLLAGSGVARAVWPVKKEDGTWTIKSYDLSGPIGGHYRKD